MNKAELISKIADDAGITKTQSNAAVDSFVEAVTKTLKGGGKVTLVGFGTFSVSKELRATAVILRQEQLLKSKLKKWQGSKLVKNCKANYNAAQQARLKGKA